MPTYTFQCTKCDSPFEIFQYFKDYTGKAKCPTCKKISKERVFDNDIPIASVPQNDSNMTIGYLADRNRETMSESQKKSLHEKHNEYKAINGNISDTKANRNIYKPPTRRNKNNEQK